MQRSYLTKPLRAQRTFPSGPRLELLQGRAQRQAEVVHARLALRTATAPFETEYLDVEGVSAFQTFLVALTVVTFVVETHRAFSTVVAAVQVVAAAVVHVAAATGETEV